MRLSTLSHLALAVFIASLTVSCSNYATFDQYQYVENGNWAKEQNYYFTFEIKDASVPYNVSVSIRNNNMYPFQNLWLFIDDEQPFGPLLRDTIECMLANDYGKWLGKGVSIYETSFLIKKAYYFPIEGEYTFSLRQGMRAKSIPGIEEVGLRVEKHNGFTEPSAVRQTAGI
jgi:gliding motility-associated lipoprotein GldH